MFDCPTSSRASPVRLAARGAPMSGQNFLPPRWGPNMKDAASLLCTVLAVGTIVYAAPVQAQIYEDMVHFYFECRYTSMAQCAASASGRSAQCVVNPYYAKPGPRKKRSH